jgi:hypothetical protein
MLSRGFWTNKHVLAFGIAAGSLVLLAAAVFMWPSDPGDYAPVPRRAEPDGETVGWVSKVEASTIFVNSGPFGGGVIPMVLTRNTRVTVGAQEGWFDDIRLGGQVKVAYDMFEGRRMARTIEILVEEGARRVPRSQPRPKDVAGGGGAERIPTTARSHTEERAATVDKSAEPPVSTPPAAAAPADVASEKSGVPTPAPAREVRTATKPEPVRTPAAAAPRSHAPIATARHSGANTETTRPRDPSPTPTESPATLRSPEPTRNPETGGTTDGSDAVDWLLKQRN